MRILGIDPGYGITGFGLVEAGKNQYALLRCGAITTPAGMDSVRTSPPASALPKAVA